MFGKVSQNSQENLFHGVPLFLKFQASATLFKKKENTFFTERIPGCLCSYIQCFKDVKGSKVT